MFVRLETMTYAVRLSPSLDSFKWTRNSLRGFYTRRIHRIVRPSKWHFVASSDVSHMHINRTHAVKLVESREWSIFSLWMNSQTWKVVEPPPHYPNGLRNPWSNIPCSVHIPSSFIKYWHYHSAFEKNFSIIDGTLFTKEKVAIRQELLSGKLTRGRRIRKWIFQIRQRDSNGSITLGRVKLPTLFNTSLTSVLQSPCRSSFSSARQVAIEVICVSQPSLICSQFRSFSVRNNSSCVALLL